MIIYIVNNRLASYLDEKFHKSSAVRSWVSRDCLCPIARNSLASVLALLTYIVLLIHPTSNMQARPWDCHSVTFCYLSLIYSLEIQAYCGQHHFEKIWKRLHPRWFLWHVLASCFWEGIIGIRRSIHSLIHPLLLAVLTLFSALHIQYYSLLFDYFILFFSWCVCHPIYRAYSRNNLPKNSFQLPFMIWSRDAQTVKFDGQPGTNNPG